MNQTIRKNVIIIIPNLDFGGAQESFSKLSVALSATHNVVNLVFNSKNSAAYPLGGPLVDLNIPASKNIVKKIFNFFKRVNLVKQIKAKHQVDVSISFLEGADYVNVLSRGHEKVILNVRGSKRYDQNISGWFGFLRHRWLLPWLYNRADHVVVLNHGIEKELRDFYGLKKLVSVIYNGFDLVELERLSKIGLDDHATLIFGSPVIVSHGRLSIEKGYMQFLSAFSKVVKRDIPCKFLLIGDGPEKEKLIAVCNSLGLSTWMRSEQKPLNPNADVFFWGYDETPEKYLSRASIFVLPSLHEGFGNALAEAMACGLPVLATDCPYSPREILSPLTTITQLKTTEWAAFGVLLPKWEITSATDQWAEAIVKLLKDKELHARYSEKSKTRMRDFAISKMLSDWHDII